MTMLRKGWVVLSLLCFTPLVYGFDLYGHRGARGLAPENSLPGYQIALDNHVDYVDMDVAMTKDHILVVQHDLALNPDITRDANGQWLSTHNKFIRQMPIAEVQQYDIGRINPTTRYSSYFPHQQAMDGTHIPTLKDAIDYVKHHAGYKVGFQIEIKSDATNPNAGYAPEELAMEVATLIRDEQIIDRVQVQSFDWRVLYALQKINPAIHTAYLTDVERTKMMFNDDPALAGLWTGGKLLKDYHYSLPQMVKALGGTYWDPQDKQLSQQQVAEAHRLGLKVVVWSTPVSSGKDLVMDDVKRVLGYGVDGIITDRPDKVKTLK